MSEFNGLLRIVLVSFTTIVHLYLLFVQNRRNHMTTVYSGVMMASILYYDIIPIIVFASGKDYLDQTIISIFNSSNGDFLMAELGILLFTLSFDLAYKKINNRKTTQIYVCDQKKLRASLSFLTWVTFIVGGATFILYIKAFGGIGLLLSYANYLRSFAVSGTSIVSYYASILVIPAKLITVTPIVAIPVLQMSNGKKKLVLWIVFTISFFLTVIYDLSNAGKTSIILFVLCFAIPILQKFIKHPWTVSIIGGCFLLPVLGVLDSLFVYMQNGVWNPVSRDPLSYLSAFAYPYNNIICMNRIVEKFGLRWGRDFLTGPLNIIPGINFQASYEVTSEFFSGDNWRIIGGTPNDIITFGYLQLGFAGVIIVAIMFGFLCGKLDRLIKQLNNHEIYSVLVTSMVVCIFTYTVNADISGLIRSQFQLYLIAFAILYSCRKLKRSKGNQNVFTDADDLYRN